MRMCKDKVWTECACLLHLLFLCSGWHMAQTGAKCHGGTRSDTDTPVKEWRNLQPCGSPSPWSSVSWPPSLPDVLRFYIFVFLEHLVETSAFLPLCLHISIWPLPHFFTLIRTVTSSMWHCHFILMSEQLADISHQRDEPGKNDD